MSRTFIGLVSINWMRYPGVEESGNLFEKLLLEITQEDMTGPQMVGYVVGVLLAEPGANEGATRRGRSKQRPYRTVLP